MWQVYMDYYDNNKLKLSKMKVCAKPTWCVVGSLWKCLKYYIIESRKKKHAKRT